MLLGGCDKTTPALVMGAISAGLPFIFVPAGPMLRARWRGSTLGSGSDVWKYWAELRAGNITQAEWEEVEERIASSPGHCMTMGTASTMTSAVEALGLSLPGAASIPAADSDHPRMAVAAGRRIVDLPAPPLSLESFENAVKVVLALGGSTNAVIHLIAMAGRAGVSLSLDRFDELARTVPVLANIRPSGKYLMQDFFEAGGLRALMSRLELHDVPTVSGLTVSQTLEGAEVFDDDVIRPLSNPLLPEGGLAILRGSLAPDGAVIKHSAASESLLTHTGPAVVFEDYDDMSARIDDPDLRRRRELRARPAQRGPPRRPRHARVGNAPDPQEAAQAGRPRHGPDLRRPHVRHRLRYVRAPRRPRVLRRRPARARPDRRPDHAGRSFAAPRSRRPGSRARPPPFSLGAPRNPLPPAATSACSPPT